MAMPRMDGIELCRLVRAHPELSLTPVLLVSAHRKDNESVLAGLQAGANDFLAAPEHLIEAVRKVTRGERYIGPALINILAASIGVNVEQPPHGSLSDREYQVLCLIASGRSVGQIAAELSLSAKTISTYRARILEKRA